MSVVTIPKDLGSAAIEPGDVLIALSDVIDMEKELGHGRVVQFDADLTLKGVLRTELIGLTTGLLWHDGILYACDQTARAITRYDASGTMLPGIPFAGGGIGLSCMEPLPDGTLIIGEHFVGEKEPYTGAGNLYHCRTDGSLIEMFDCETHGGVAHFLGVTHISLVPDGKTLFYISETGNRLMRFDLAEGKQMPDFLVLDGPPFQSMLFGFRCLADGGVLMARGTEAWRYDDKAELVRRYELPASRGWANISLSADGSQFYAADWYGGAIAKIDLASGEMVGQIETGLEKALAGVIEIPG